MTDRKKDVFVTQEEWLRARLSLLAEEKELTRRRDMLAAARRKLPMTRVEKPYRFETEAGERDLAGLFGDQSQLVVCHFMYGADWDSPCLSCSFWADSYSGISEHLAARDARFVAVSRAPLDRLLACKRENGWKFDWVSERGTAFGTDFGVYFEGPDGPGFNYATWRPEGEMPGLSVFRRTASGAIGHCYSTYARGLEPFNAAYQLLDLTPKGRDEDDLPWTMAWVRRPHEYGAEQSA